MTFFNVVADMITNTAVLQIKNCFFILQYNI